MFDGVLFLLIVIYTMGWLLLKNHPVMMERETASEMSHIGITFTLQDS
jgi:hypothetical protein